MFNRMNSLDLTARLLQKNLILTGKEHACYFYRTTNVCLKQIAHQYKICH